MNTAQFASSGFLAPLQGLWRWFAPATLASQPSRVLPTPATTLQPIVMDNPYPRPEPTKHPDRSAQRPLRIVRILEADQAPANVGRMVISGRMAEVCAELERLAAREAALH